jgi:hypothetical protein
MSVILDTAECPLPVTGEYDRLSAENEVAEEMPSLVCVLSGRLMKKPCWCVDEYSYEEADMDAYIKENGKRIKEDGWTRAPSPRVPGLYVLPGMDNDALWRLINEAVGRKFAGNNVMDVWT